MKERCAVQTCLYPLSGVVYADRACCHNRTHLHLHGSAWSYTSYLYSYS